jgi:hypothetical protein
VGGTLGDVICRRFERATGLTPVRAGTGEAVSFEAGVV